MPPDPRNRTPAYHPSGGRSVCRGCLTAGCLFQGAYRRNQFRSRALHPILPWGCLLRQAVRKGIIKTQISARRSYRCRCNAVQNVELRTVRRACPYCGCRDSSLQRCGYGDAGSCAPYVTVILSDSTGADRVHIACGYTDLRLEIAGLAALVKRQFALAPFESWRCLNSYKYLPHVLHMAAQADLSKPEALPHCCRRILRWNAEVLLQN